MSTCVFLTTQPVMGTVAAEDVETGTPLVVTAHDYNPLLYYIDAAKGQEVRVTYDAMGAAKVLYTPPPLIDPGGIPEPGQPTETRTIKAKDETVRTYHEADKYGDVHCYVELSFLPYLEGVSSKLSLIYEKPDPRDPVHKAPTRMNVAPHIPSSDIYPVPKYTKVFKLIRIETLEYIPGTTVSRTVLTTVPADVPIIASYKYEEIIITPPGQVPPYVRQPGCSATITAKFRDGSMAGVVGKHTVSVRDCTGES